MDRYYKESDIKAYLEGKAEHYKKRIKRIKGYGKKVSYDPKEQIEGWQTEVAIYESMIRELTENVSTIETNEDCISREWVRENMLKYGFLAPDMTVTEFVADAPSVVPEVGDSVSKRYLLAEMDDLADEFSEVDENGLHSERWCGIMDSKGVIENAPSVTAEWKWESQDTCDNCGYEIPHLERIVGETVLMDSRDWEYCPNCGNRRKGTNNE